MPQFADPIVDQINARLEQLESTRAATTLGPDNNQRILASIDQDALDAELRELERLVSSISFPTQQRLFRARFSATSEFMAFGVNYGSPVVQYGQDYPCGQQLFQQAIRVTKLLAQQAGLNFQATSLVIARDLDTSLHIDAKNPRGMTNFQFTLGQFSSPTFATSCQGRLFVALPKAGWERSANGDWVCVDTCKQNKNSSGESKPLRPTLRSNASHCSIWVSDTGEEFCFPEGTEAVAIIPLDWRHSAERSAGYLPGEFVPGVWIDSKDRLVEFYAVDTPHATEGFFAGDGELEHRFNFTWYNQANFEQPDDELHAREILKLQAFSLPLPEGIECLVPRVSEEKLNELRKKVTKELRSILN